MKALSRFFVVLSILIASFPSFAEDELERSANAIFKLNMSPDEIVDSVCNLYSYPNNLIIDSVSSAKAERFFRERLIPYAKKNNCSDENMARIYDDLGLLYIHQGPNLLDRSMEALDQALEYVKATDDYYQHGLILEHKSQNESRFGDMANGYKLSEEAIRYYKKAGAIAEQRIIRCYYTQAVAYLQGMDLSGLRRVIDNIEKFSKTVSEENRAYTLYNLYSVQEVYYGTMAQSASPAERKALSDSIDRVSLASILLIEANYDDWIQFSIDPTWNYYNRAVLFMEYPDRPNVDSVEYYLNKALSVDMTKSVRSLEAEISAASLRAEMWMKLGDYAKAKNILLDTLKLLENTENINNVIYDKIEIYKNLVEISRNAGHYEEALDFADALSSAEKERFSEESAKNIKELEIRYKTQETELALAHSEARRANILMWLFAAAGLLLLSAICFMIYVGRQRRQRIRREMEFAALKEDIGRQLTLQYVEGLENERQRMSRELHDGVCNDLLAIQMNITGGKSLESTVELLDSCRESVRRISHELMPPEFSYATIEEVVRFFVTKQSGANMGKINISFTSSLGEGLSWQAVPDDVSLEVYRIVQEAIGNALKHSGASDLVVSLNFDSDGLTAEVRDNGIFKSFGRNGIGLESIRRRAKAVNGTMEIISDEKTFTEVRVTIPMKFMVFHN